MKTEICKEQYAASMTAMPASSKEQNRSLKRGLSRQELSLQQCYVMIRKEQVVARAVIYDEHSYIGNLTLEAIEQTEADQFVRDVIGPSGSKQRMAHRPVFGQNQLYTRISGAEALVSH